MQFEDALHTARNTCAAFPDEPHAWGLLCQCHELRDANGGMASAQERQERETELERACARLETLLQGVTVECTATGMPHAQLRELLARARGDTVRSPPEAQAAFARAHGLMQERAEGWAAGAVAALSEALEKGHVAEVMVHMKRGSSYQV